MNREKKALIIFFSIILFLLFLFRTGEENVKKILISLFFIGIYIGIFWKKASKQHVTKGYVGLGVLLLVFLEVFLINYDSINVRGVKSRELKGQPNFQDGTEEAITYLQKEGFEEFYRIDKQYISVSLCDSLAQNFYGTSSYVGFTESNGYVGEFFASLSLPKQNGNHLLFSSSINNEINSLWGVKYILSKGDIVNYGYNKIEEVGGISIYENEYPLSIGFLYSSYMDRLEFEKLSFHEKRKMLLKACVLDEQVDYIEKADVVKDDVLLKGTGALRDEGSLLEFEPLNKNETLIIDLKLNNSKKDIVGNLLYNDINNQPVAYKLAIKSGENEYRYEVNTQNINKIKFDFPGEVQINYIKAYKVNRKDYYSDYLKSMENLYDSRLVIDTFTNSTMYGSIDAKRDGILFVSIPYDKNWKFIVDGENVPVKRVNIGFMGIELHKGTHKLKLIYDTDIQDQHYLVFFSLGIIVCIASIILPWKWKHK